MPRMYKALEQEESFILRARIEFSERSQLKIYFYSHYIHKCMFHEKQNSMRTHFTQIIQQIKKPKPK